MVKDHTIREYDRIANDYSVTYFNSPFWEKEYRTFKKLVPGKRIIEIGCGPGRDAAYFLREKFDYIGTDASRGMVAAARKNIPAGKFRVMSFYDIKFSPGSFDGFWAAASLLHAPKRRVGKVLRALNNILTEEGVGFISLKERAGMDHGMVREHLYNNDIVHYFSFYSAPEFKKILRDNGFKVIYFDTKRDRSRDITWLNYFVRKA